MKYGLEIRQDASWRHLFLPQSRHVPTAVLSLWGRAGVRRYVVVDEGHRLKNSKCKLITLLRTIPASQKLLLTGAAG